MTTKPKGWNVGATDTRFADTAPSSYDKKARTVDAVLSMGTPVARFYGTEVLRISPQAVDLGRMKSAGIPLLDSHQGVGINNHLGRLQSTSFGRGSLNGTFIFDDTDRGRHAEGMVARGEVRGISVGYAVREWQVTDGDGNVIDPEIQRINFDDDLTFTATNWELNECSLVSVPADASSYMRSLGSNVDRQLPVVDMLANGAIKITKRFGDSSVTYEFPDVRQATVPTIRDVRARMIARQRMQERARQA